MKARLILLLASLVLCTACGAKQIKGEPPFVSISSLTMQVQSLSADFDIRNINDVRLEIDEVDIEVWVRNAEFSHFTARPSLTVDPNTTEKVSLQQSPDSGARQMLAELESGEVASLPFSLEGRVHTAADGYLRFKQEGHLYPVPGRPGQFRSASSRTREER